MKIDFIYIIDSVGLKHNSVPNNVIDNIYIIYSRLNQNHVPNTRPLSAQSSQTT